MLLEGLSPFDTNKFTQRENHLKRGVGEWGQLGAKLFYVFLVYRTAI